MAILLFVHLTRHASTANEQLSCQSDPTFKRGAGGSIDFGRRQQIVAAQKLVELRNKLAETVNQIDELMGNGSSTR
jgi:hypothetical protein